jgi:hypothetical protein
MNHTAVARTLEPLLGLSAKLSQGYPCRVDVVGHALLREVECHLEARDDINEPGLQAADLLGQPARQRTRRQCNGAIGPRADHQRDGLGLRQVEAAVQERAAGELAGRRQARAAGDKPQENQSQQGRRAVT